MSTGLENNGGESEGVNEDYRRKVANAVASAAENGGEEKMSSGQSVMKINQ